MIWAVLACLAGLVLLVKAADAFVEGAARLAASFNVSPVVIGAVVLGFGTSAPELLVSGIAAGKGERELGVGNVIGSNVANLSLVLGVAALITLIKMDRSTRRRETPLSLGAALLFAVLVQNGFTRLEGVILLVALVAALGTIIWFGRADGDHGEADDELTELLEDAGGTGTEIVRTVVGLVGTLIGAQLLVEGSTFIAEEFNLTGGFVGFSLVALGTSLPELVTTVAAARQGETGLIAGNLLGSNIFNSLAVGAVIGLVGPGPMTDSSLVVWGVLVMVAVSFCAAAFLATGSHVTRIEAVVLLLAYVGTLAFLSQGDREETEPIEAAPAAVVVVADTS